MEMDGNGWAWEMVYCNKLAMKKQHTVDDISHDVPYRSLPC
jgi:hypothetical protein